MKTKKTVSFFLAFLLLFVSLITSLFEVTFSATKTTETLEAKAATTDYGSLKQMDSRFEWLEGASILLKGDETTQYMRFSFHCTDMPLLKFTHEDDYAIFYFTVCRVTEKKYVPIYQLMMYCIPNAIFTGYKKLETDGTEASDVKIETGEISFYPTQRFDLSFTRAEYEQLLNGKLDPVTVGARRLELWSATTTLMESFGFTPESFTVSSSAGVRDQFNMTAEDDPSPDSLCVTIKINSVAAQYCVVGKYELYDYDYTDEAFWWWDDDEIVYKEYKGEIKSSTRSVKGVIQKIENAGLLEEIFDSEETLAYANTVLGKLVNKEITISYLQQIGSSPFATMVDAKITVPVMNDKVAYDDVLEALNVDTLNLLGATVNAIEFDGNSSYVVRYLSSVKVEAKTTDGNLKDYFLRLEKSLDGYYRQYVEDGVFEEALIEYMLNDAKLRYPVLTGYEAYEIYGLWGYVVVPETNSFNSLFVDVFNKPTNFSGTYFHFASHDFLSLSEYNTLLETYNYGWITRVWESMKEYMVGDWTHECTHYLFYADPKYQEVNIGENGGDLGETGGAIQETVKDGVEEIRNSIEENASWWRWTKAIIAIVGVVAGALGIVYVLVKIGVIGGANGSAKTKPKKKKK